MGTFIVFAEKNPQDAGAGGRTRAVIQMGPLSHAFGVVVAEEPADVAAALASGGIVQFSRAWGPSRTPVWVNAAHVLYIQETEVREEEPSAAA